MAPDAPDGLPQDHAIMHRTFSTAVAAVVIAIGFTGTAQAGFVSGRELLDICSPAPADPFYRLKVAECRGYVVAVADTADCSRKDAEFTWDSTANPSQRALVDKVIVWLRSHPGTLHFQANGLVAAALAESYPCGGRSGAGQKAGP